MFVRLAKRYSCRFPVVVVSLLFLSMFLPLDVSTKEEARNLGLYSVATINAEDDECKAPLEHKDGLHGVVRFFEADLLRIRNEMGHHTCKRRTQKIVKSLNSITGNKEKWQGYFCVVHASNNYAEIKYHYRTSVTEDSIRIARVGAVDARAYNNRYSSTGEECAKTVTPKRLAHWWARILSSVQRVVIEGRSHNNSLDPESNRVFNKLYYRSHILSSAQGGFSRKVFEHVMKDLSQNDERVLQNAAFMLPCSWTEDKDRSNNSGQCR